jgi:prevent-host-death family protein
LTKLLAKHIFVVEEDAMHLVTMHEAKTNLSKLVRESLEGVEVVIARGNQPLVKLVPISPVSTERRLGGCPELIVKMDDDFDAPLEDLSNYM